MVDEVLHFIIRKEAKEKYSITKSYDLRRLVRSKGIGFAKSGIDKFLSLIEELYVRVVLTLNLILGK